MHAMDGGEVELSWRQNDEKGKRLSNMVLNVRERERKRERERERKRERKVRV